MWWFSNGYGYDQIPKQSQLVYLIHFDQLSLSPLKTQAIFIILAVLVTKRIQHVLPKL